MLIGRRKLVVSPDFCWNRKYLKIDTRFLLSYFCATDERKFAYLFSERLGLKFVKPSYGKVAKAVKPVFAQAKTEEIIVGDGNCLFRSFAFCITGKISVSYRLQNYTQKRE